jgi:E3 ubiquitin-protein ligase RNF213
VIPVVLLDEIGLAEISKYNPLKVLHGLIEPAYPKESLDIAVVGLSNWSLDSAKMNRVIHLSRPEPGKQRRGLDGEEIREELLSFFLNFFFR